MNQNNNKADQDKLLHEGLEFFGAITASVTHELNNVLGTIDQISGLLEDLAVSSEHESAVTEEQMNSIAERINKQTARGTKLVKRLNTFSHSSDTSSVDFNIYNAIENLTSLMKRLVGIKKINLELSTPNEEITVTGNTFFLLQAVFLAINRILPFVKQGTTIEIALLERSNSAVIIVKAEHENTMAELSICSSIKKLSSALAGSFEEDIGDESYECKILIPMSK